MNELRLAEYTDHIDECMRNSPSYVWLIDPDGPEACTPRETELIQAELRRRHPDHEIRIMSGKILDMTFHGQSVMVHDAWTIPL